jgi:hypothetical protein
MIKPDLIIVLKDIQDFPEKLSQEVNDPANQFLAQSSPLGSPKEG